MTNRINIYGPIGFTDWDGAGVLLADVVSLLAGAEGDIDVHVNSPGGYAWEGAAIYNALKEYNRGAVTIVVDGIAASAASLIAMAGKMIRISEGALLMIHDPSHLVFGSADEHRKAADYLDMLADDYAGIYARRSGNTVEDVRALMRDETWMTGAVALKLGFADEVGGESATAYAFAYSAFRNAPPSLTGAEQPGSPWRIAAMAAGKKEVTMTHANSVPAATPATATSPAASTATVDADAIRMEATNQERQRCTEIRRIVMTAKLGNEVAETLITEGVTLDVARSRVIDAMASNSPTPEMSHITVTADASDRWRTGVSMALLGKARLNGGERNEFTSLSLRELARSSLDLRGVKMQFRSALDMVGAAFMSGGMHTTSDFAFVLQNIASKSMLKGWEESQETFELWTDRGSVSDFKKTARVGLNLFPNLGKIEEGAEYTYGTMGDRGEEVVIATYGKLFALSRQAIINDDTDSFTKVPRAMGRAAKRTVGNLVYAVLTGNPAMSDGVALGSPMPSSPRRRAFARP